MEIIYTIFPSPTTGLESLTTGLLNNIDFEDRSIPIKLFSVVTIIVLSSTNTGDEVILKLPMSIETGSVLVCQILYGTTTILVDGLPL